MSDMFSLAELIDKHRLEMGDKDRHIAELGLKSCTLDLTKGHLSQCEAALESRDNRIAELEKEVKGYQVALSMPANNESHNLEQQANGVEAVISKGDYVSNYWLSEEVIRLRNQAKALKEQGE